MKKYIANTAVSVSVSLPEGGYTRVSFSPHSDGTSVYYTDDEEIQWALEHHYKYGKLFRLETIEGQGTPAKKTAKKSTAKKPFRKPEKKEPAEKKEPTPEERGEEGGEDINDKPGESEEGEESQDEEEAPREVRVTDMDDAKDYLAENYGVVRTKLKSEEIIKATAHTYGIVFKTL